ncbi:MAG: low specificity L-threonine aldolase [Eubacteriaceae bacterium]
MRFIDLRSDTVTQPTEKMRTAMATAIVGDDVYDDDPTVKELEALATKMLGKEAALFVPSGTFGNQLAILTHTQRGQEIIVAHDSHIMMHEVGASAVIAGVHTRSARSQNGFFDPTEIQALIRGNDIHYPETGLICLENAHSSGCVVSLKNMADIYQIAQQHQIPVHLDGARFFNAARHLHVDYPTMAAYADSLNICLSKGLCAPVGSLLVGSQTFINKAKKNRKLMGGGMRQVGILAAAGLIALQEMVERLDIDHENARCLADQLETLDGITVQRDRLDINMVFFKIDSPAIAEDALVSKLLAKGIKVNGLEENEYRFVTNNGVSKEDIDYLMTVLKEIL